MALVSFYSSAETPKGILYTLMSKMLILLNQRGLACNIGVQDNSEFSR